MTTTPMKTEGNISDERLDILAGIAERSCFTASGTTEVAKALRELQALRLSATASEKDAERYRWLRGCSRDALEAMRPSLLWGAEHLDANIDAAMEKANG